MAVALEPVLNELQQLGFRLASTTRVEVLRIANELSSSEGTKTPFGEFGR